MNLFWPSVSEERAIVLRERYPRIKVPKTPWRSNGPILSSVFFILTAIAITATFAFFELLRLPKGWITLAITIAVAEFLILGRRWFGTGVESALWLGGLVAWIAGLPSEGKPEALLLFAAAAFVAGARVRSAIFGTLGLTFVVAYFAVKYWWELAFIAGIAVGVIALMAVAREWKRPSTERFFALVLIFMPLVSAIAAAGNLRHRWALVHVVLAALCAYFGTRYRHHAALIAAFVNVAIAAVELHDLIDIAMEWKLIAGGLVLLAVAGFIAHRLRGRTQGIVTADEEIKALDVALPIAVAVTAMPAGAAPAEQARGGGGEFGGAGASGQF
jgi:hypothetical protein